MRSQRASRESSGLGFTETWLHQRIPDSCPWTDGLLSYLTDGESGKKGRSGLAILVHNKRCNPGYRGFPCHRHGF